jgi:hypothetical protein
MLRTRQPRRSIALQKMLRHNASQCFLGLLEVFALFAISGRNHRLELLARARQNFVQQGLQSALQKMPRSLAGEIHGRQPPVQ